MKEHSKESGICDEVIHVSTISIANHDGRATRKRQEGCFGMDGVGCPKHMRSDSGLKISRILDVAKTRVGRPDKA